MKQAQVLELTWHREGKRPGVGPERSIPELPDKTRVVEAGTVVERTGPYRLGAGAEHQTGELRGVNPGLRHGGRTGRVGRDGCAVGQLHEDQVRRCGTCGWERYRVR